MKIHLLVLSFVKIKKRTTVEDALKETNQPIGVATYKLSKNLPQE